MQGFRGHIGNAIEAGSKEGAHHDQDVQAKRELRLVCGHAALVLSSRPKLLQRHSAWLSNLPSMCHLS